MSEVMPLLVAYVHRRDERPRAFDDEDFATWRAVADHYAKTPERRAEALAAFSAALVMSPHDDETRAAFDALRALPPPTKHEGPDALDAGDALFAAIDRIEHDDDLPPDAMTTFLRSGLERFAHPGTRMPTMTRWSLEELERRIVARLARMCGWTESGLVLAESLVVRGDAEGLAIAEEARARFVPPSMRVGFEKVYEELVSRGAFADAMRRAHEERRRCWHLGDKSGQLDALVLLARLYHDHLGRRAEAILALEAARKREDWENYTVEDLLARYRAEPPPFDSDDELVTWWTLSDAYAASGDQESARGIREMLSIIGSNVRPKT